MAQLTTSSRYLSKGLLCLGVSLMALSGCASLNLKPPTEKPKAPPITNLEGSAPLQYFSADSLSPEPDVYKPTTGDPTAYEPPQVRRDIPSLTTGVRSSKPSFKVERPRLDSTRLTVSLPQQSVPEFINSVYGEILGLGFVLGPGVIDLESIVAFRSANNVRKIDLFDSASAALRDYGVAIYYSDGQVRAVMEDELRQQAPRFIRSRARSSVPNGLRPVVQFVELYAISVDEIVGILKQAFTDADKLTILPNPSTNALTLTGLPREVDRALAIINELDELRFGGQQVATLKLENWEAEELATTVNSLLTTEGFSSTTSANVYRPITMRAIPFTNQLVIFAKTDELLDYAVESALRLENAANVDAESESARIYQALYYKAGDLITLISPLLGEGAGTAQPVPAQTSTTTTQNGSDDEESGLGPVQVGGFVADEQSNRIIFTASADRYAQLLSLLRQLDTPPPEVLIEVTIAEVTVTADTRSGVEFLMRQVGTKSYTVGTLGGLGLATGGLTGRYSDPDGNVNVGALSSGNQINVLSTPRVVAKSGASASIQVGTDVPVITSQTASDSLIGGNTDILQSVDYRKTGVLLEVSPTVLSADRIDIEISQEVSSAEENPNQGIASPIISSRTITSELTLQDGQSAILGGLIENRYTEGGSGVPFLKDIPIVGRFFSTETLNESDTVLLFMITPYILDTADDRARAVEALAASVNRSFNDTDEQSKTLMPRRTPVFVTPRNQSDSAADQP